VNVVKDELQGDHRRLSRHESRALTRARLVEAAGQVFAERGFYGASVEEIAERAGFSRGAFYSNFESKEDLFLAVLDSHIESEMDSMAQALGDDPTQEAVLEFLRSQAIRRSGQARRWTLLWAEFWLHVLRQPELAPKLAARQRQGRIAITRIIESRCRQLGIVPTMPPEDLASLIMAVDDGLVMQEHLDPGVVPEDLRARAAVLLFVGMAHMPGASRPETSTSETAP
jgi:AcrR family transcriptional regulator